jgi:hypothetical protein
MLGTRDFPFNSRQSDLCSNVVLVGNNRCDVASQRGKTDLPAAFVLNLLCLPLCGALHRCVLSTLSMQL